MLRVAEKNIVGTDDPAQRLKIAKMIVSEMLTDINQTRKQAAGSNPNSPKPSDDSYNYTHADVNDLGNKPKNKQNTASKLESCVQQILNTPDNTLDEDAARRICGVTTQPDTSEDTKSGVRNASLSIPGWANAIFSGSAPNLTNNSSSPRSLKSAATNYITNSVLYTNNSIADILHSKHSASYETSRIKSAVKDDPRPYWAQILNMERDN